MSRKSFLTPFSAFALVTVVVFVFLVPAFAHAATYYVDSFGGSDLSITPTSSSTPWQTIAKVNSSTFNPGDNVLFKAGDTWREQLTVPSSGASGTPITFGSYGSGAQPIITGANVVTGWTASSLSSNWVSEASGFNRNDSGGYIYTIKNGSTTVASGSVSQANMRLSILSGLAFVDFGVANSLTSYSGDLLTITDSASHQLVGYIGAAGTGETYGVQLLPNSTFATTNNLWTNNAVPTVLTSGCYSTQCLQVSLTANYGSVGQPLNLTGGMLIKNSAYLKKGTEAAWMYYGMENPSYSTITTPNPYSILPSTWTRYVEYATADSTSTNFSQYYNGGTSGETSLFDSPSAVQVLTPSATGAMINSGTFTTAYYASYTIAPTQIFEDGNALAQDTVSKGTLIPGQWYLDTANSKIWVRLVGDDNPSGHTMTASQRNDVVYLNGKSYVAIQNLQLSEGGVRDVFAIGNSNYLQVLNNTIKNAGGSSYNGCVMLEGASYALIQGNNVSYCGSEGIDLSGFGGAVVSYDTVERNDVSYFAQSVDDAGGLYTVLGGAGNVFRYNRSHNGGTATTRGEGAEVDTNSSSTQVYDNEIYLNTNGCIDEGSGSPSSIYNNTCYHDSEQSWDYGELLTYGPAVGVVFKNNIAVGSVGKHVVVAVVGNTFNSNLYYGGNATPFEWSGASYNFSNWEAASEQDSNSINSDPLFVSTSSNDFALQSSSPDIDAGLNLGSTYEYGLDPASTWPSNIILDNQNNYGSGWDIGAYEYTQTNAPSVAMTAPTASSTVSGTISVTASSSAVAPASITSVQFYLDGSPLGSAVTSSPYTISWNTGTATNASHTLYALATDNYSNTATSTSITVTVANQAVLSVPTSTLNFSAAHGSAATSSQSVVVKNAGATSTTLNWSASSNESWLTFSPASGSLSGNATTSISFIVNPAAFALGTYNATATISDPAASSSPQTIPVTLTISSTGVSATMTAPANLATVSSTVPVTATATSTVGISSVQFYLDGSPLGSAVTSSPYTISWNTLTASDGSHTLYSQATDNNSNIASSSEITIIVDNTPPAVSITFPTGGATLSGTTSITASSSDALSGVSSVAFYLDGSLLGESTSSPYSINWDTTQASNGSHSITALSTDGAGNATTSQAISFTVDNVTTPPIVVDVAAGYGGVGLPQSAFILPSAATTTAGQASSPTTPSTNTTISTSSLQAELNALLAELQALEAQAGNTTPIIHASSSSSLFTTYLQLWDEGPEVTALQSYLIQQDKGPAAEKLKAHGTTNVFGFLTYNALVEFQASLGIHATGYFGPITRAYVNGHE